MQAIDNSGILNYNKNFDYSGFTPWLQANWNLGAATVTVVGTSMVLPAVDGAAGRFTANVQVHDNYGNTAYGQITDSVPAGSTVTVDISDLITNKGINVTADIAANNGWQATGSAFDIPQSANTLLQDWNISESMASADESLIS